MPRAGGRDRTTEFFSVCQAALDRDSAASESPHARLLTPAPAAPMSAKSEFSRTAAVISQNIQATVDKLQRLAALARRRTLFDDKPMEINELIYTIKQDIAKINGHITQLGQVQQRGSGLIPPDPSGRDRQASASRGAPHRQIQEHSTQVIASLQGKLALTSNQFKNVLEIRTQNLKDQKSRREQYGFGGRPGGLGGSGGPGGGMSDSGMGASGPSLLDAAGTAQFLRPQTDSPLYRPSPKPSDGALPGAGGSGGAIEQLQLQLGHDASMSYLESRGQAIESIESTIAELGQIYQHFTQLLAGQRDMVSRIDDNVMEMETNVIGAHNQLLRHYQSLTSNRWLMLKVFGVLIVFFLLAILVM
ncbi:hypothetical protein CXG81DRAFT_8490 [Caulochytrium protostelioides]|uniref:t-SNARE n=1 Tax=Caulochytrium protostelioides TaxID=1555241 RepID=A0A4P9XFI3_9FUNG|nr:t-SNARE [Caulochytrium protostelioides]RKP04324.1 hypothetical protein CXG81DRAFT_8490 [Caulochytrium protostelioides]|eukprot:RKP04324.1 hypothetical protein CXG81DRAFT_8490 [Caulochytrium protostelioides]